MQEIATGLTALAMTVFRGFSPLDDRDPHTILRDGSG